MIILIINLLSCIMCECIATNQQNSTIFHRHQEDDLHNGHAKPAEAEKVIPSWRIINKKSAPRSNKYFVTWRPDLSGGKEQNEEILSIILEKHRQDQVKFRPQFYFPHQKQTQTLQPFLTESIISVSPPPSSPAPDWRWCHPRPRSALPNRR